MPSSFFFLFLTSPPPPHLLFFSFQFLSFYRSYLPIYSALTIIKNFTIIVIKWFTHRCVLVLSLYIGVYFYGLVLDAMVKHPFGLSLAQVAIKQNIMSQSFSKFLIELPDITSHFDITNTTECDILMGRCWIFVNWTQGHYLILWNSIRIIIFHMILVLLHGNRRIIVINMFY